MKTNQSTIGKERKLDIQMDKLDFQMDKVAAFKMLVAKAF